MLSILAKESAHSIRFLYRYFLSGITENSLTAFYYACCYVKVDYSRFMNVTASITLKLVPELLLSNGSNIYKSCKVVFIYFLIVMDKEKNVGGGEIFFSGNYKQIYEILL